MLRSKYLLCLLTVSLLSGTMYSQEQASSRPRVGLVLSGGGAKGMAHVGVLKVLEEVGLEPDYITGTSMGSIMGGLYSIGYTAEELSRLIETVDWGTILTNEIPSDQVIMRRKHEYRRYILELPVYNMKPQLPSGLIEGQKLSALFSELAWPAAGVDDFTQFPYPYTCIGTDILEGKKVLLNSGDLSSAMRASMAIPSVFTAVERDSSNILVDGGVVRNMPVDEVIDLGADLVVGVYVGFDRNLQPEDLRSLTSVITRTSLLSGSHDVEDQLKKVDYLIVPDLEGFSASSFTDGVEIMNRGEIAARAQIETLRTLADSINRLGPPPGRNGLPENDSLYIASIRVLDSRPALTRFVIERSGIGTGVWITPEELNSGLDRLFGTLFFDKIEYYFNTVPGEGHQLVFRIKEKAHSFVRAAIHYDNAFGPGLILNYTLLNALVEGSRLGLAADISENSQFRGYYDFHLGKKRTFIGSLFLQAEREQLPFYEENTEIGSYQHSVVRAGAGFRQGLGINNHAGADLFYRYSTMRLDRNIKFVLPELSFLDMIQLYGMEAQAVFRHNGFDHHLYPTRGSRVHLTYRQAFSTRQDVLFDVPDSLDLDLDKSTREYDPYWQFIAETENYIPIGQQVSVRAGTGVGLSKDERPFVDSYYLGGFNTGLRENQVAFLGLNSHEVLTGNYLFGRFGVQVEPLPNLFISALANLMFYSDVNGELLDAIFQWRDDHRLLGAGAGFVYRTPIGPVSVFLGSRTDQWNPVWHTSVGFTF